MGSEMCIRDRHNLGSPRWLGLSESCCIWLGMPIVVIMRRLWRVSSTGPNGSKAQTMANVNINATINTTGLSGAEAEWAEAALNCGSAATGRWEACQMSQAQQQTIFKVGLRRGQGMLPLPGIVPGKAVWCHAQIVADHHVITPSVYWTRQANGSWAYESCTGNTHAKVALDGHLVGRTLSTLARAACNDVWVKGDGVPPEIGNVTSEGVLNAAYDASLAAIEASIAAHAAYAAGSATYAVVSEAQDTIRRLAAFALAMGASEWVAWHG